MASAGRPSGDLLDRCTLALRVEGEVRGTGILVAAQEVLTCAHVVDGLERVEVADGASREPLASGTVIRRGDLEGGDDLALLELDTSLPKRGVIHFGAWKRGESFSTAGFPDGKDHVHGQVEGVSKYFEWLQFDATGCRAIRPGFSGGAVWVESRGVAVGLVTHHASDGVAYAITTEQIQRFCPRLFSPSGEDLKKRCSRFISRVARHLKGPEAKEAILAAAPGEDWRAASGRGTDALAEALCLETEPDDLVVGLCQAFCDLHDEQHPDTAEQVFGVLLEALPAAVLNHWQLDWPEGSAKEVRLALLNRVLAEFALAASEGAAAGFHRQPERADSDEPRAIHEIPGPGELGADLDGQEGAQELAEEVLTRLAFEVGSTSSLEERENRFLARLAVRRPTPRSARFVDRSTLKEMERADADPQQSWRQPILALLNEGLSEPTQSGKRHLYLVAEKGDESLVEGLRRVLPKLKIVTLKAPPEEFAKHRKMIRKLRTLFLRRRNPERPNS